MGMTRAERIALHKKQDRLLSKEGVPTLDELKEGVPVIRTTTEGLVEYLKQDKLLYKTILEQEDSVPSEKVHQSLGTDGYQVFDSGLIIQWGHETTDATVTFPIPFPTACLNIVTGKDYEDGHGTGMPRVYDITASNFKYESSNQANTDGYWQAIGY